MKAALVLVGTELLNGGMLDTNSIYMAEELNKYGVEIEFKITVRDIESEILKTISYCKNNVDLVILSGGLGPTLDDITKEVIAKYLGKPLIVEDNELKVLKEKLKGYGVNFSEVNVKEVEKPKGAISFTNDIGMAPAIYIDGIAAFPGVPKELYNMFPKFLKWYGENYNLGVDKIYIKDILTFGIAESILDTKVREFFTENNIHYEFLVKDYGILIRMQTTMSNKNKVEKITKKIYNRIGEFIFGEDNDRLETKLIAMLKKLNFKISVAESCTGGMLASTLIGVPGVSNIFNEGIICYSNESKMNRLGVKKETLDRYGAVSEEVAYEMLLGLKSDIVLSITGIAGPEGGTEEKPVGLVYIGIKVQNKIYTLRRIFKGDRNKIRRRIVSQALFSLIKILNEEV